MGSIGKSEQQQTSQGQATSFSQAGQQSFVDPQQVPFFQSLFQQASGLANQQLGPIAQQGNALSQNLLTSGQQFISGLQGQASGLGAGVGQAVSGLLNFGQAGAQPAGVNPGVQGQISALQDAIQANLAATGGTIAGQATLQGQTGGSRQALATGVAAGEAQRQFAGGASALISQDFRQQQATGLAQSQQRLQALQAAGQLGTAGAAAQAGAGQAGLGALGGLFDLGLGGFGAAFSPLSQLAQILGPATVLSTSQASARSQQTSQGQGSGSGFSFGLTPTP